MTDARRASATLLDDLPALDLAHRREVATEWRKVAENFAEVPDGRHTAHTLGLLARWLDCPNPHDLYRKRCTAGALTLSRSVRLTSPHPQRDSRRREFGDGRGTCRSRHRSRFCTDPPRDPGHQKELADPHSP